MKKAVVIYDSRFGNTKTIAGALAYGMEKQGIKVDCLKVDNVDIDKLVEYDFLALGSPTHMLGMSVSMQKLLEKLKTVELNEKKGFCFDTRVQSRLNRFDLNSAAKRIEKKMKKMKVRIIKHRTSAVVEGREGPLEKGIEKKFEKIGTELAKNVLAQNNLRG
jgi:flavodoxin